MRTTSHHNPKRQRGKLGAHAGWLLITVITFVGGSQLARPDSNGTSTVLSRIFGARVVQTSEYNPGDLATLSAASESTKVQPEGVREALPASESRDSSSKGKALSPLTEAEIEELAIAATKSTNPVERRKAFDRLLQEMQSDTFTTEQAMMMRSSLHENGADGEQWRAFDYAWGANDPEAALDYVNKIPEKYRNGYTSNMVPGLASVDPQMAIELVGTMEGRQNFHMTGRLIEGLVDHDVGYATDYVSGLVESGAHGATHHVRRLTDEVLSTAGLEHGVAWAEGLDSGQLQANALRGVAHDYANKDPHGAADWATQFVGQDQNSRLFGEVVREWGDVNAATEWVNSLEPSLAQRDALSAVYGFRGSQEPHEALQDIMNMPQSDNKDFALNGFISGLAHQDGEAAVAWAAEISSPGMRESAMVRAGQQFFQQDQQAASEWFNASGLPETTWNQVARPK